MMGYMEKRLVGHHHFIARQSFGQSCLPLQKKLVLSFKYWKFVLSVQLGEGMLVQTLLCCLLAPSLNWAKLEREPALVVGRQLHFQLDHRVLDVGLGDHCIAVIPSRLMVLRTWLIVSIPTHATPSTILFKLVTHSSTENFVVIVVDGIDVAKPPHRVPGRRVH